MAVKLHSTTQARAKLSPGFLEALKQIRSDRRDALRAEIKKTRKSRAVYQRRKLHDLEMALANLQDHDDGGDIASASRRGLDYELARLRRQPYEFFTTKRQHGKDWLIAKTRPIVAELIQGHGRFRQTLATYDAGAYFMYLDIASLGTLRPAWHLLPERDLHTFNRHPHHVAHPGYDPDASPLEWHVNTCWGEFAGIAQSLWQDVAIAELFRVLHIYTSIFNHDHGLVGVKDISYVRRLP